MDWDIKTMSKSLLLISCRWHKITVLNTSEKQKQCMVFHSILQEYFSETLVIISNRLFGYFSNQQFKYLGASQDNFQTLILSALKSSRYTHVNYSRYLVDYNFKLVPSFYSFNGNGIYRYCRICKIRTILLNPVFCTYICERTHKAHI